MQQLKIEYIDPSSLFKNPWNSNECDEKAEAQLEASISRLEMFDPIKVRQRANGDLEILGGQHRTEACIRLGHATVPVVNLGVVDDKVAREMSLVDNGRYGKDDSSKLLDIMQDINPDGKMDLDEWLPFDKLEMDAALASQKIDLSSLGRHVDDVDLDDESQAGDELMPAKTPTTHTLMRFSVTNEDAAIIQSIINEAIVEHRINDGTSLNKAGDALAKLLIGE